MTQCRHVYATNKTCQSQSHILCGYEWMDGCMNGVNDNEGMSVIAKGITHLKPRWHFNNNPLIQGKDLGFWFTLQNWILVCL